MPAPSKHHRISYYLSLPLVAAVVFLLVARLVAMQRADIIAKLSDRVEHREAKDASDAVRELASMAHPPAKILVEAASSSDRKVATEAQHAINKWLGRAQRQVEARRSVSSVAKQMNELSQSLAAALASFSAADQTWLANTAQHILRIANKIPPKHAPLVAVHCDEILSSVRANPLADAKAINAATPAAAERKAALDELTGNATADQSANAATTAVESKSAPKSPAASDPAHTPKTTAGAGQPNPPAEESDNTSSRPAWSRPVFRMLPEKRQDSLPHEADPSQPSAPPTTPTTPPIEIKTLEPPLAKLESRVLLQKWLAAGGAAIFPLEEELAKRGFGRPQKTLVEKLFSKRSDERLQLVDDVITNPEVNARPWLIVLADDSDADVRLAAVTVMATSNDAALTEKAWQTAIHDRDPRIARLAGPLRDRRANTQRR